MPVGDDTAPRAGQGLYERVIAFALVAGLFATAFVILAPFGTILLWSLSMAVTIWPVHEWVRVRTGGHPHVAATFSVGILLLVVVTPMVLTGMALLPSLRSVVELVARPDLWDLPDPPEWLRAIPVVGHTFQGTWKETVNDLLGQVTGGRPQMGHVAEWAVMRVLGTSWTIVQVLVASLLAWPMLVGGARGAALAGRIASRVGGQNAMHLVEQGSRTIRYVSVGVIGSAAALALVEGLGLWLAGVPLVAVLMVASFVLDVMQVGIHLVYLGAAAWLFFHHRDGAAVFTLLWGFVANNVVDSVARPYVIGKGTGLPMSVIFLGATGGLLAWGFIGVLVGPTLLGLAWTMLRGWAATERLPGA